MKKNFLFGIFGVIGTLYFVSKLKKTEPILKNQERLEGKKSGNKEEISMKNIENLYRKFKSYVYYDNSTLHLRNKLADFESSDDFQIKLEKFKNGLEELKYKSDTQEDFFKNYQDKIGYLTLPKSFEKETLSEEISCITNFIEKKEYNVEKVKYYIDAPIEIHLLSFYWVLKYGSILEEKYEKYNYGNILDKKCSKIEDVSTKTFKPYFLQYSKWRDTGIKKVQDMYKNNEGSAILMLDIVEYYTCIKFDFKQLNRYFEEKLSENEYQEYLAVTNKIEDIFRDYNRKLCNYLPEISESALPIGLVVSSIFANFYLLEFDKKVTKVIKPLYYARYVDDIMIVFSEEAFIDIENEKQFSEIFIEENLIQYNVLKKKGETYIINIDSKELEIQKDKMKLCVIDKNGSSAIIDNFIQNIKKNSSEFRYLPDERKVISEFNITAYSMFYNGTHNKFRSIEKFDVNSYGISTYLAKIILTTKYWNDDETKELEILIKQINDFFTGLNSLKYYSLWEKVFTFYVVNNKPKLIERFYDKIIRNIESIKAVEGKNIDLLNLKAVLKKHCYFSKIQAYSLNLEIADKNCCNEKLKKSCEKLRKSNLIKDHYLIIPLVNYSENSEKQKNLMTLNLRCSKYKKNEMDISQCKCQKCELELDESKFKFSPRFIHYHEIQQYKILLSIYKYSDKLGFNIDNNLPNIRQYNNYSRINEEKFPQLSETDNFIKEIQIPFDQNSNILKVGVVSIKVNSDNISNSYLKNPNLSRLRLNNLIELLNYIERTNSDIVVFPEVSIPIAWLGLLSLFAKKCQKAIVFGIEHVINKDNFALNLLATILPFKVKGYNYSYLKVRLKNHYSPDEIRLLKGYRYNIPTNNPMTYDLFHWKGVRFTCFNCFELADISHRASFRSKIDFLTASEYNKDTTYFSNIAESTCRDLHCYFIQSNSSEFGDSRILAPSKSFKKDIVKLKGGINDQVVVGEINIDKLRSFQFKEFELQKDDDSFKPTPPNFNKYEIEKVLYQKK